MSQFVRLVGKTVFITGASSGIGMATALEYAKHGSHLVLAARRTDRLMELQSQLQKEYPNSKIHSVTLDVRDKKMVEEAVSSLPDDFKNVDILVNNAGLVLGLDPLEAVNEDELNTMLDTNVKGLMFVTQALLPSLKLRPWGAIVNVNSIAGTEAYANGSVYCATKHAVTAITKALRHELVQTPINVISIEPGLVETEFSVVRFRGDKERADSVYKGLVPLTGQDIAETICFATSRAPHVQIASMVVFPTAQSAATTVFRR